MLVERTESLPIRTESDVLKVRQAVRAWSIDLKFGLVEQTKIVTATSELARNTLGHGGGGDVRLEVVNDGKRRGLRLVFEDQGPGIPDVEQAMQNGFTTAGGMGLGLPGSKRLVNEFDITSTVGAGTRVTVCRWK